MSKKRAQRLRNGRQMFKAFLRVQSHGVRSGINLNKQLWSCGGSWGWLPNRSTSFSRFPQVDVDERIFVLERWKFPNTALLCFNELRVHLSFNFPSTDMYKTSDKVLLQTEMRSRGQGIAFLLHQDIKCERQAEGRTRPCKHSLKCARVGRRGRFCSRTPGRDR